MRKLYSYEYREDFLNMAIFHCSAKIISRSSGRSAVGASAYRSCEKLYNEHDGITHDYTHKLDLVHSEIMLCDNAPTSYQNRQTLWNAVEKIEKRSTAQLAREIQIALPVELSQEEQIRLVKDYVKDNFVSVGMCADFAIHDKQDGNPHAHIMLTMRSIDANGEWESKSKFVYQLDKNGDKIYNPKKRQYKGHKQNTTDWNDKSKIELWREDWANKINISLKLKGIDERVDHRSYERQKVEKIPTIHLGSSAHQLEQKGVQTDRGNHNRTVLEVNQQIEKINEELKLITDQPSDIRLTAESLFSMKRDCIKQIDGLRATKSTVLQLESMLLSFKNLRSQLQKEYSTVKEFYQKIVTAKKEIDHLKRTKTLFKNNKSEIESKSRDLKAYNKVFNAHCNILKREWSIEPTMKNIENRLKKYTTDIEKTEKDLKGLPSKYDLRNREQKIIMEYKTACVLAEFQSNYEQVKKEFDQLDSQLSHDYKNMYNLNDISNMDRKKIAEDIKNTHPKIAQHIHKQINNFENNNRGINKGHDYER